MQNQLSAKLKMLNLLTQRSNFSSYLTGLAGVDMQGIWLTDIIFNNVTQKIYLKGFALQSELIAKTLVKLETQPAFTTLNFEVQNIIENSSPLSFEISSKPKGLL